MEQKLSHDPEYQLPDPPALMTGKTYKTKVAAPLVKRLKSMLRDMVARLLTLMESHYQLELENRDLRQDNEYLREDCDTLTKENTTLREQTRDYSLLKKAFGKAQIDDLVKRAWKMQPTASKQRQRSRDYER